MQREAHLIPETLLSPRPDTPLSPTGPHDSVVSGPKSGRAFLQVGAAWATLLCTGPRFCPGALPPGAGLKPSHLVPAAWLGLEL